MKVKRILLWCVIPVLLSSCATIVGGAKYNAAVRVVNDFDTEIIYKGEVQGEGTAIFSVPRRNANKLSIELRRPGCATQVVRFNKREFRPWAFIGSLLGFIAIFEGGVVVPFGPVIDVFSGALWKPSVQEPQVSKINLETFHYELEYSGCGATESTQLQPIPLEIEH